MNMKLIIAGMLIAVILASCTAEKPIDKVIDESLAFAAEQYALMTDVMKDKPGQLPRTFNEKGEFSVDCETYGGSLNDSAFKESRSSRITAISMLSRLENSDFRILNPPKSLDIAKYSTADVGIRSTFSTVTRLQLNLRYVPSATGNRP